MLSLALALRASASLAAPDAGTVAAKSAASKAPAPKPSAPDKSLAPKSGAPDKSAAPGSAAPKSAARDKSALELQAELSKEKAASAQLAARETSLLGRLADLERQVEVEGRALKAAQTRVRLAQSRLQASEQQVAAAQAAVDDATRALGPRLTARYQLGREGYVRFLLGSRSIGELLRRKRLYSALLEADLDAIQALRFKVAGLQAARDEQQAARDETAQSAAAEQERRAALELKATVQKKMLASVQQERAVHEQAVRELELAAKALTEKVKAIDDANRLGGSQSINAPVNNLNANHSPAAPSASGAGGSAGAGGAQTAPGAGGSASAAASEPGKKLAMIGPPIRSQRGKLLFPVDGGRVEAHFGRAKDPRFGTVTLQRGLDIRAPEGATVRAIYGGTVVHAGWFSGYGNLMILDHGDGLFSLFAHLGSMAHAVGEQVAAGDAIGTLGDTGSLKGAYLYFELRDGQKPLDPERWLSRAKRK